MLASRMFYFWQVAMLLNNAQAGAWNGRP